MNTIEWSWSFQSEFNIHISIYIYIWKLVKHSNLSLIFIYLYIFISESLSNTPSQLVRWVSLYLELISGKCEDQTTTPPELRYLTSLWCAKVRIYICSMSAYETFFRRLDHLLLLWLHIATCQHQKKLKLHATRSCWKLNNRKKIKSKK